MTIIFGNCNDCGKEVIVKYTEEPYSVIKELKKEIARTVDCGLKTQKVYCKECYNKRK